MNQTIPNKCCSRTILKVYGSCTKIFVDAYLLFILDIHFVTQFSIFMNRFFISLLAYIIVQHKIYPTFVYSYIHVRHVLCTQNALFSVLLMSSLPRMPYCFFFTLVFFFCCLRSSRFNFYSVLFSTLVVMTNL